MAAAAAAMAMAVAMMAVAVDGYCSCSCGWRAVTVSTRSPTSVHSSLMRSSQLRSALRPRRTDRGSEGGHRGRGVRWRERRASTVRDVRCGALAPVVAAEDEQARGLVDAGLEPLLHDHARRHLVWCGQGGGGEGVRGGRWAGGMRGGPHAHTHFLCARRVQAQDVAQLREGDVVVDLTVAHGRTSG